MYSMEPFEKFNTNAMLFFLQVLITFKEYYSLLYKGFDLKLSNKFLGSPSKMWIPRSKIPRKNME